MWNENLTPRPLNIDDGTPESVDWSPDDWRRIKLLKTVLKSWLLRTLQGFACIVFKRKIYSCYLSDQCMYVWYVSIGRCLICTFVTTLRKSSRLNYYSGETVTLASRINRREQRRKETSRPWNPWLHEAESRLPNRCGGAGMYVVVLPAASPCESPAPGSC